MIIFSLVGHNGDECLDSLQKTLQLLVAMQAIKAMITA